MNSLLPPRPRAQLARAAWLARTTRLSVALVLSVCGCASLPEASVAPAAAEPPPAPRSCPVSEQPELSQTPRLIAPDERVPDFLLASAACEVFDSRELVGKQPFVIVFFASWCSVCEHKIPILRDALRARAGQLTSLWVTLDDAQDGWAETEGFLARHELGPKSAVAGRDYLGFSLGYNPFRSVPVVVIVGRSGRVVGVQIGVREGDDALLNQALDEAIDQAPERSLFTSFPRP
jgi:thiol-disulfide isomerase/thioredoxin